MRTLLLSFALLTALKTAQAQTPAALTDPSLPTPERVAAIVHAMTLDEKVSQMMNSASAIPRLGIPSYDWWSEGLHGIARSGYATVFPQAIGMAATWDKSLMHDEGAVIATEARAKFNAAQAEGNHARYYGLTIWSPNINIFRDPRWGRGQETYGEDPTLTGTLAVNFVRGLQGTGSTLTTIATPKHYAVHSGPESTRHTADVQPSPHDLEDTYTPAFRAAVVDGGARSLMCAYNAVNGSPACASKQLLGQILRESWGFKGYVVSDCDAIDDFQQGHKTSPDAEYAAAAAVLAGTDLNCGGTYHALTKAVRDGLLPESAIDQAVTRLFTARVELGLFDPPAQAPFRDLSMREVDTPAHRALALRAARESMVLLKNDGILPLKPVKTIAVVGPNAASLLALEGNYNAIPSAPSLPVDALRQKFSSAKVVYAQGAPYLESIELPAPRTLFHTLAGQPGLFAEYFKTADLTGQPAVTRTDPEINFDWTDAAPVPGLNREKFSVRWTGTVTPPAPGKYQFGLKVERCDDGCGGLLGSASREGRQVALTLDGKPIDVSRHTPGADQYDSVMPEADLTFTDTKPHRITVEYSHLAAPNPAGISLRWLAPVGAELREAVAAAKQADVTVAFVGITSELEGEEMPVHVAGFSGGDRTSLDLPAPQQRLLEALSATGKPLIVVLGNGSALSVNWAQEHANAILEAWYPGEAGGQAIAETLAGVNNPSGKLPVTFYANVNDLPAFENYDMRNRTYRYYSGKPLYPFGYGLSYTMFTYENLTLSASSVQAGQPLTVEADVRNTGGVAGEAVPELYLIPPRFDRSPKQQLTAFDRVALQPGARAHLKWTLAPRDLSTVDAQGMRAERPGAYTVFLGDSQAKASFAITGEQALPR